MARNIRIEYEGAYYHVMARGNQRGKIFLNDEDQRLFLSTLGDVCKMTGWRVHGWVLMKNHYHLFIQTPEANLVAGMKWLQNTYTRRFNVRHKNWGRLFGDRYKAILVEGEGRYYYETLLDYIHLNPVRAGLVKPMHHQSLLDYPWSSIAEGYALAPSKRKIWMACEEGLKMFGFADTAAGRRKMIGRLDRRAIEEVADQDGISMTAHQAEEQCSKLSRNWYWGTESFSEKMLSLAKNTLLEKRSTHRSTPEYTAHTNQQATIWLQEGLKKISLTEKDLADLKGSDSRKIFLALFLRQKTTVSNGWLAEHLKIKSASNVSHRLAHTDVKKLINSVPRDLVDYVTSQGFEI